MTTARDPDPALSPARVEATERPVAAHVDQAGARVVVFQGVVPDKGVLYRKSIMAFQAAWR
jgi:hypothetical protein